MNDPEIFPSMEALFGALRGLHRMQMRSLWRLAPENSQVALELIAKGCGKQGEDAAAQPAGAGASDAPRADMTVSQLAERLHMSLPATSRLVGSLEKQDLVCRRTDPDDRRRTLVALTEAGDAARRQGRAIFVEYAQLIQDGYGADRAEALVGELSALIGAMRTALSEVEQRHPDLADPDRQRFAPHGRFAHGFAHGHGHPHGDGSDTDQTKEA